jgi:diketogulonate reductase-like aldo/keto reductase
MSTTTVVPTVTLNNGVEMPVLGFGVFQIPPDQTEQAVTDALAAGYRSLDTAAAYNNEVAVGRAIAASGIPRDELFVTTKLWVQDSGEDNTKRAFKSSLRRLGVDYVDLYLIHQPFGDYYSEWRAMQELHCRGLARAIGVANFYPDRLVDLIDHNEITPAVSQVECHPFFQRAADQELMRERGVQIESWGAVRRRPQQPVHQPDPVGDRRRARQVGRSGRPALAQPAQGRRHSEVGPPGADARESRCLRLRADRRRDGTHRRNGNRRIGVFRPP